MIPKIFESNSLHSFSTGKIMNASLGILRQNSKSSVFTSECILYVSLLHHGKICNLYHLQYL